MPLPWTLETVPDRDGGNLPKVLGFAALHRQVIVVYVRGDAPFDYAAYITVLPDGMDHDEGVKLWRANGRKISRHLANVVCGHNVRLLEMAEKRKYRE